jgi:hypothetical protein
MQHCLVSDEGHQSSTRSGDPFGLALVLHSFSDGGSEAALQVQELFPTALFRTPRFKLGESSPGASLRCHYNS